MSWRERAQDILFASIQNGTTSSVHQELDKAKQEHRQALGKEAEMQVVEALNEIDIVSWARLGNEEDDQSLNDILVSFTDNRHLPIGIQLKISKKRAQEFKRGPRGKEDPRRMVMHYDPDTMSEGSIRHIFLSQLEKMDGYV